MLILREIAFMRMDLQWESMPASSVREGLPLLLIPVRVSAAIEVRLNKLFSKEPASN